MLLKEIIKGLSFFFLNYVETKLRAIIAFKSKLNNETIGNLLRQNICEERIRRTHRKSRQHRHGHDVKRVDQGRMNFHVEVCRAQHNQSSCRNTPKILFSKK